MTDPVTTPTVNAVAAPAEPVKQSIIADVKTDVAVVVSFYAKAKTFAVKYGITAAGVAVGYLAGKLI